MQKDNKAGFWICILLSAGIIILCILMSIMFSSCNGPKTYEFQYSVDVRYEDNSRETLVGTSVITTKEPERVRFTMSSRLRMKPCLTLGREGVNVACEVKSFTVNVLKYEEVK